MAMAFPDAEKEPISLLSDEEASSPERGDEAVPSATCQRQGRWRYPLLAALGVLAIAAVACGRAATPGLARAGASPSVEGKWSLEVGPMTVDSGKGVELEPKFAFGFQNENVDATAGVGDVRQGVGLKANARARHSCTGHGHNFKDVMSTLDCGSSSMLGDIKTSLTKMFVSRGVDQFKQVQDFLNTVIGTNVDLISMLDAGDADVKLHGEIYTGAAVSAKAALGVKDKEGYHMKGVSAKAALGVGHGAALMAGMKGTDKMKIIVYLPNFIGTLYLSNLKAAVK